MNKLHLRKNGPTTLTPPTNRSEERNYLQDSLTLLALASE
jgi:hypothetical protein